MILRSLNFEVRWQFSIFGQELNQNPMSIFYFRLLLISIVHDLSPNNLSSRSTSKFYPLAQRTYSWSCRWLWCGKIVIDSSIIYFCLVFFIYSQGQFKKHFVAQKPMHVCFMNHEWNIKVEHSGVKYSLKEYCYIHVLAFSNEMSKQNRYEE